MNVNIYHPEEKSLEVISQAINNNQDIRRSPHVGNVNANELTLILGLTTMGGHVELELVDTIQGNDRYSQPRHMIASNETVTLLGAKSAKGRVVGMCTVSQEGAQQAGNVGVTIREGTSVADIHISFLEAIMPSEVTINKSSEFFAGCGEQALRQAILSSHLNLERPLRSVDDTGKIVPVDCFDTQADIFGLGENKMLGVLPPLEVMMAVEFIMAAQSSNGGDTEVIHIGGPDMVEYTKNENIMKTAMIISQQVISELGIKPYGTISYVVPSMKSILDDVGFPRVIDETTIQSQYDLLQKREQL